MRATGTLGIPKAKEIPARHVTPGCAVSSCWQRQEIAIGVTLAIGFGLLLAANGRAAALNPIYGRDKIVRFFEGVAHGGGLPPAAVYQVHVNGLPGFVIVDRDGNIDTIATIDIRDGHVAAIYAVRNPDKLAHVSLSSLRGAARTH